MIPPRGSFIGRTRRVTGNSEAIPLVDRWFSMEPVSEPVRTVPGYARLCACANEAASVRLLTAVLLRMLLTWRCTVFTLITSSTAI